MSCFPFSYSALRMEIIAASAAREYDLPAPALHGRLRVGSAERKAQIVAMAAARQLVDASQDTVGAYFGVNRWPVMMAERAMERLYRETPENPHAAACRRIVATLNPPQPA